MRVLLLLEHKDFNNNPGVIHQLPPLNVVNVLLSLLVTSDEDLKNRVVKAMGEVVSKFAEKNIEVGWFVMRWLILSVTEESGGIVWNTPEAMGEIMVRRAIEYHKILISYSEGGGNELDFEGLQKSVIAGLNR